jgi:hypothetical protein
MDVLLWAQGERISVSPLSSAGWNFEELGGHESLAL